MKISAVKCDGCTVLGETVGGMGLPAGWTSATVEAHYDTSGQWVSTEELCSSCTRTRALEAMALRLEAAADKLTEARQAADPATRAYRS